MGMKKIEALIVPSRLEAVCAELRRGGIYAELTLTAVRQGNCTNYTSSAADNFKMPAGLLKLELIVGNRQAQRTVDLIFRQGQPGSIEEGGHIAVLDVCEVFQITSPLGEPWP